MSFFRPLIVIVLLTVIAGGILTGAPPATAQPAAAQWTILIYLAADNNLESYGLADLNEMEFVGSSDDVNVIVQIDRAEGYDASDDNWTEARRYRVLPDSSLTEINSEELAALGETNTGDPSTLIDFATWTITAYPAERYGLIIWDHGGSWFGVANDDSAEGDGLTLPELDAALNQITQATGIGQFEMIGFDACLMGSLEVYGTIAPYARYAVGSAELIPGNGWDYLGLLDALRSDPTMTGDGLGRAIVDSFIAYYTEVTTRYKVFNLALVDLGQIGNVTESMTQLAGTVQNEPSSAVSSLVLARSQTPQYGAFDDPRFIDTWGALDLLGFLENLTQEAQDSTLSGAAQQAYEAGAGMVLYYRGSEDPTAVKPGGVSIYFPRNARLFQGDQVMRYNSDAPSALMTRWSGLLETFFQNVKDVTDPQALASKIESVTGNNTLADVAVDLGAGQQSTLIVLLHAGKDQKVIISYKPLISGEPAAWDGQIPWLTDGTSEVPVLVLRDARNADVGVVNGRAYLQNGAAVEVQLAFDLTTNLLTSVWALTPTTNGLMPSEIAPLPGDIFHPLWITTTPGGRLSTIPASEQLPFTSEPFKLVWKRASVGEYTVLLHTQDMAGNNAGDQAALAITSNTDQALTVAVFDPRLADADGDGVPNPDDNCPALSNPDQADFDGDGLGDACDLFDDTDADGDGIANSDDDCPALYDPAQDAPCEWIDDADADGIPDDLDLCASDADSFQADQDWDGIGDACDPENTYDPADDYFFGYGDYGDYSGDYGDYSDGYGDYSGDYGDYSGGYGDYAGDYGDYSGSGGDYSGSGGDYSGSATDSSGGDYSGGGDDY